MLIYKSSLGVEYKMAEQFTQKEMLIRILDKLDKLEEKIEETHILAAKTNGKIQMHTKSIYALGGVIITLVGWFIYLLN